MGCLSESLDRPVSSPFPFDAERTEFFFGKIECLLSECESLLSKSGVFELVNTVVNMRPVMGKSVHDWFVDILGRPKEMGYSSDHFMNINK